MKVLEALGHHKDARGLLLTLSKIHGPWAFVFWQVPIVKNFTFHVTLSWYVSIYMLSWYARKLLSCADALKAWCTTLPFLHDRSPLLLCGLAVMCLGGEVFCGTSPPQMMTPSCSHLLVTMTLGICLWYDAHSYELVSSTRLTSRVLSDLELK